MKRIFYVSVFSSYALAECQLEPMYRDHGMMKRKSFARFCTQYPIFKGHVNGVNAICCSPHSVARTFIDNDDSSEESEAKEEANTPEKTPEMKKHF